MSGGRWWRREAPTHIWKCVQLEQNAKRLLFPIMSLCSLAVAVFHLAGACCPALFYSREPHVIITENARSPDESRGVGTKRHTDCLAQAGLSSLLFCEIFSPLFVTQNECLMYQHKLLKAVLGKGRESKVEFFSQKPTSIYVKEG